MSDGTQHTSALSAGPTKAGSFYRGLAGFACFCTLGLAAVFAACPPVASAAEGCPNEALRTEQGAVALPACRAWEMVSPADKNGGDVMSQATRTRVSTDGNAASFTSLAGFADVAGTGIATEYLSRRDAVAGTSGWATHGIVPKVDPLSLNAATGSMDTFYPGEFSSDLSKGVLRTFTNLTGDPFVGAVTNLYLRSNLLEPGAATSELLTACPVCVAPLTPSPASPNPNIAAATPDLGHIIFESKNNLLPGIANAQTKLYEWDHGTLRFAGILPDDEGGGIAVRSIAGVGVLNTRYTVRTMSDDGSRIFFTVEDFPGTTQGDLYLRENHNSTVRLNASERTDCAGDPSCGGDDIPDPAPDPAGPLPALFQTAGADGSKAFFTTAEALTDDDDNSAVDLYVYDAGLPPEDPHNLTRVSVDHEPADGVGAEVVNVAGASADGSYVYFFATAQLVAGAPAFGLQVVGLFAWHQGAIRFIGTVGTFPDDAADNALGTGFGTGRLNARVTPDGKSFLFRSHDGSGLTGYDHAGCGDSGIDPCTELYLYRFDSDTLVCASCNPSGAPATADASFDLGVGLGGSRVTAHLTRPLSDDGSRVFFTSGEALVAADRDAGANDAYEYDADSGQVHLLSSGRDKNGSYFLDASPSGDDVFFTTRERLLGWDRDNAYDLYDARSGGGFREPPLSLDCAREACQGSLPANAPSQLDSASSRVFGPGNAAVKAKRHRAKRRHKAKRRHRKGPANKRAVNANRGGSR